MEYQQQQQPFLRCQSCKARLVLLRGSNEGGGASATTAAAQNSNSQADRRSDPGLLDRAFLIDESFIVLDDRKAAGPQGTQVGHSRRSWRVVLYEKTTKETVLPHNNNNTHCCSVYAARFVLCFPCVVVCPCCNRCCGGPNSNNQLSNHTGPRGVLCGAARRCSQRAATQRSINVISSCRTTAAGLAWRPASTATPPAAAAPVTSRPISALARPPAGIGWGRAQHNSSSSCRRCRRCRR